MSEQLGFVFLILFVVAAGICIYLALSLASDRSKMQSRIEAGISRYVNDDRQGLIAESRQLAHQTASIWLEQWQQEREQQIRLDAVQRSQAITRGKVTEHIVPYLPGFDFDPKDIRFLGTPIDLIAFSGLNASAEDIEIIFIEVKTGGSVLSSRERAVKKAVEQKRVAWRIINPDVEVRRPL
jgi:predicted Holliday junction resolvase-like endonuclease